MIASAVFILHSDSITVIIGIVTFLATGLLAYFTMRNAAETKSLAQETKDEIEVSQKSADASVSAAEAARRQADVSEKSFASLIRPWLTSDVDWIDEFYKPGATEPYAFSVERARDEFSVYVRARLNNVGPGLALIDTSKSWVSGYGHLEDKMRIQPFVNIFTDTPVVPSGSTFRIEGLIRPSSASWTELTPESFCFPPTLGGLSPSGEFHLDVAYTDAAGLNEITASFRIVVDAKFTCRVYRIAYFANGTDQPFSTVTVGLPGG